jgi:predicted TIM-barrel fold metal-dependent hydrolase
MSQYRAIDADGHFTEPASMWPQYLAKKYHPMAPKGVRDNTGRRRIMIGGRLLPYIPAPPISESEPPRKGGFDPHARLADMDAEDIEAMITYPTTGLMFFGLDNLELTVALCQAFNNWAHDFCAVNPRRLISPAILPQMDIGESMAELRRGVGELGLRGAFLRPNPVGGRTLDNPAFEPLWSLIEELDQPLVLHEGTTQDLPQVGMDRYDNFLFRHMISHAFEQQMALLSLIAGGVLQRHPRLRVVIVEAGCGWVPYWVARMDHHMKEWGHASIRLKLKPSEYFRRQCYVSADGEEEMIPEVISRLGDENICFSTDYPHPDHPFQGVVAELAGRTDIADASKKKILADNVIRAFKL